MESVNNEYYCEALCDEQNPFIIVETQECVDYCDIDAIISKTCTLKYINEIKKGSDKNINEGGDAEEIKAQEIKIQDKILENVEKSLTSDNFNTTNIENGNDNVIEVKKMTITLTTTENKKNSMNNNATKIDFDKYENILRKVYNIPIE